MIEQTGAAGFARPDSVIEKQAHVQDVIDTTIGSLQHAIERINSIEYRLRRIADRTVGQQPTPMTSTPATPREPTIQGLLGDLGGSVERLFTELNRLNEAR